MEIKFQKWIWYRTCSTLLAETSNKIFNIISTLLPRKYLLYTHLKFNIIHRLISSITYNYTSY